MLHRAVNLRARDALVDQGNSDYFPVLWLLARQSTENTLLTLSWDFLFCSLTKCIWPKRSSSADVGHGEG